MESWRKVFREGLAPLLTTHQLDLLRVALVNDDPRLLQGATTCPPPLQCVSDWPVESACLTAFAFWQDGLETVNEVEEAFARACFDMDQKMGEPAACRWLLNFWDDTPRPLARQEMLGEVQRALAERLSEEPTETVQ